MPLDRQAKNELGVKVQREFGEALRKLRRERALSQEALALRAGLHTSYVAQVERGLRNISLRNICLLARTLEIDIGEFFHPSS